MTTTVCKGSQISRYGVHRVSVLGTTGFGTTLCLRALALWGRQGPVLQLARVEAPCPGPMQLSASEFPREPDVAIA